MEPGKELLLSVVLLLSVFSAASKPLQLDELRRKMGRVRNLPFENLIQAEKDFVQHVFIDTPPVEYGEERMDPLPGITLPVGNATDEIWTSLCAINDYTGSQLPKIIRKIVRPELQEKLISNTMAFSQQFKYAAKLWTNGCQQRSAMSSDSYIMKENGLRILYFTRRWLVEFTAGGAAAGDR